jgi:predicted ester cyclase
MMPELTFLRGFAKRYTAAWCSRNAASVAAFFAAIGSLSVNGDPAVGRRAITEVAQGFMSAFPDMELLMDDIRIEGDRAVYRWTFIGTNTGAGGTGKRVRFSGFEEWKFGEDGLIAESQGHFDVADYQRQLKRGAEEAR